MRPPDGYKAHPFAEIFPFRDDDSLTALSDNIAAHGQHVAIVLLDGKVLNGRRRQAACIAAGVEPWYRDYGSDPWNPKTKRGDGPNPLQWAFNVNFHARGDGMSRADKEMAVIKLATLKKGYNPPKPREKGNGSNEPLGEMSQKEAAKKMGVPLTSVKRRKTVLSKGTPKLIKAMRDEIVAVSDAFAIVNEPAKIQNQAVAAVRAGAAKTLVQAVADLKPKKPPAPNRNKLVADLRAIAQLGRRIETDQVAMRDLACENLDEIAVVFMRL